MYVSHRQELSTRSGWELVYRYTRTAVSARCYTSPALLASLQVCVFPLRAVFFLAFLLVTSFFFFSSSLPFSISIWTSFVSSCGYSDYAVSSVSVSAAITTEATDYVLGAEPILPGVIWCHTSKY